MSAPDLTPAEIDTLLDGRHLLSLAELATILRRSPGSVRLARWRGTLDIPTVMVAGRWFARSADVRALIDPPEGTDR